MVCGTTQIWPLPTGRVSLSKRSLTFNANQMSFDVKSTFNGAKQLLLDAYNIFLGDVKTLGNQHNNLATNLNKHNKVDSKYVGGKPVANTMQNCDINKIVINAEITAIADTALHLEMDESYELNVTCEL